MGILQSLVQSAEVPIYADNVLRYDSSQEKQVPLCEIMVSEEDYSVTKIVVIGGGCAGISAAVGARKAGAEVTLLERQDQLLGIGRIAGSMDVGGRYPLHLEIVEMGGGEVNEALDSVCLPNVENYRKSHYPHHSLPGSEDMTKHSWVYNVLTSEPALRKLLKNMEVEIRWRSRAVDVEKEGNHVTRVKLADGEWIAGDAFIDTTGSAGGQNHCIKDVGGCVMCPWMQCTTFGNRVDISGKAGAATVNMHQKDGTPGIKYNGLYLYKALTIEGAAAAVGREPPDLRPIQGRHRLGCRSGMELGHPGAGW